MKKTVLTLLICLTATLSFADNILIESFEYGNHDLEKPVGWICDDNAWLCGYLEKDHSRMPHTGNWYAFTDSDEAWMFMPLYLLQTMKYRFEVWAVSDGAYSLSFWAGPNPSPEAMTAQFVSEDIGGEAYAKVSAYVEQIPEGSEYIGICAIKQQSGSYLTIDDLVVDMVEQYTFEAEALTGDTAMYPGTQATFRFLIHNTGYDAVDITAHPSTEFFTDISCYVNGVSGMTFPTEPDQTIEVTAYATLRPEIEPGTVAWLDIQMTIPCNCNTAMVTFWVTPLDITGLSEDSTPSISVFPNPATDYVTVEAEGLRNVQIIDLRGRVVIDAFPETKQARLSVSDLQSGVYVLVAKSKKGSVQRAFIKQ